MKNIWLAETKYEIKVGGKTYVQTGRTEITPCKVIYEYEEKQEEKPDGVFMVDASGYPQLEIKGNPPHTIIVRLKEENKEEEK